MAYETEKLVYLLLNLLPMVEFAPPASGSTYVSPAEIRKLKKNMQKVPEIQAKSDAYHQKEAMEAEIAFAQAEQNIKNTWWAILVKEQKSEPTSTPKKTHRCKRLWEQIKNFFK